MTREEEAIMNLSYILVEYPETSARGKAVLTAIEALAKIEAIQEVVDMPALWEPDDRRRYAKVVDIIKKTNEECADLDAAECKPKEGGQ